MWPLHDEGLREAGVHVGGEFLVGVTAGRAVLHGLEARPGELGFRTLRLDTTVEQIPAQLLERTLDRSGETPRRYGHDMSDKVHVRRLRDPDREAWDELWNGYLRFYRTELAPSVTESAFRLLRDGEQGMLGLVAVDEADRPVGLAHLVFHPSTWSAVGYCYLEDLYVRPDQRGGAIAHALFDAVYAAADERGAERVYWHTQQFNGAARSLYDVVGRLTSFVVYEHELGA